MIPEVPESIVGQYHAADESYIYFEAQTFNFLIFWFVLPTILTMELLCVRMELHCLCWKKIRQIPRETYLEK